jgi:hypothetical protein
MLARQKEQYTEATARAVTLAVAWLTVGAIGLPAIFIAAALVAVVLGLFGLPVGTTMFVLVVVLGLPSLLAGFAWFVSRRTAEVFPSRRLVLWLRRFNQTDLLEFPFASFLERASRGIAVPVTLQDSTVTEARTAASMRPEYYALTAAAGACWFGFAISGLAALAAQSWTGRALAGTLAALALAGFFVVIPRAMNRLGALRLGTPRGERLAARLLEAIDSEHGVPQTLTILSCPDTSWQSWVLDLVKRADAVLVDVTRLSANLHWELRTIAERLDPRQLILAVGTTGGTETGLPPATLAELVGVMGEEMVERSQRFFYALPRRTVRRRLLSMTRRRNGWIEVSKADTRRYGPRLAEALNAAFAASDRSTAFGNENVVPD